MWDDLRGEDRPWLVEGSHDRIDKHKRRKRARGKGMPEQNMFNGSAPAQRDERAFVGHTQRYTQPTV
jgi:hypothetical protein